MLDPLLKLWKYFRDHGSVIRSSLAYIVISSSRQNNQEEEDEEEEELDLRLRKLSIEAEDEEGRDSIDFSRQESISTLNRQESTTESESSSRSASSLSPGTDQVTIPQRIECRQPAKKCYIAKKRYTNEGQNLQGLQLNMSAREMRDRLQQRRR